ncbi:MAG TPA: hypothetical protein VNI77_10660 [Nitrososphaera sp.]|nr:hypothetical protein [Nitrososphaera sp.]
MVFEGPEKRKQLLLSMGKLAAIVIAAGLGTVALTGYFRSQDPIYHCIENPEQQPYQISVPVTVTEDGLPIRVPAGVGIEENCIRPVHTLEQNVIHVGYSRPHKFTLGHFLYYWIGNDLSNYDTQVYVNDEPHSNGSFLDIPLRQGDSIRIEFKSRN